MQLASSLANNPFSFRQRLSSSPVIFYARRVCLWPNCRSTVKKLSEAPGNGFSFTLHRGLRIFCSK
jgi:hypothetical protein